MDKGVNGLDNARVLRDAASRDLRIVWNILTAIPGETCEDYERMLQILPLMRHLPPPTRWGPIRISRYSPYHNQPEKFGIKGLRPWQAYYELFGEKFAERVALHFFGEYTTEFLDNADLVARLDREVVEWTNSWKQQASPPTLSLRRLDGGWLEITDTRHIAQAAIQLVPPRAARVLESLAHPVAQRRFPEEDREVLQELMAMGYVIAHEKRYLSLVTEPELGQRLRAERNRSLSRRADNPSIEIPLGDTDVVGPQTRRLAFSHSETLRI
jgi:hypothetical protein